MGNRKYKIPNACKHGIFSIIAILPGEDAQNSENFLLICSTNGSLTGPRSKMPFYPSQKPAGASVDYKDSLRSTSSRAPLMRATPVTMRPPL